MTLVNLCKKFDLSDTRSDFYSKWNAFRLPKVSDDGGYSYNTYENLEEALRAPLRTRDQLTVGLKYPPNFWDLIFDLCAEIAMLYLLWGKDNAEKVVQVLLDEYYEDSYLAKRIQSAKEKFHLMLKNFMVELEVDDSSSIPLMEELHNQVYFAFRSLEKLDRNEDEKKELKSEEKIWAKQKSSKFVPKTLREKSKKRLYRQIYVDFKVRGAKPRVLDIRSYH